VDRKQSSSISDSGQIDRAEGCLYGQLIGDALGSLVEFESPERIHSRYPDGVRDMHDGGTWNTIAGQPTDDSELALALARVLVERGGYDRDAAWEAYLRWYRSGPFDIGTTISAAFSGTPNEHSQSNGALMRSSPLGIFAARKGVKQAIVSAREDVLLTHPNPVTQDANAVFVATIAKAVADGPAPTEVHAFAVALAREQQFESEVIETLEAASDRLPSSFTRSQGWVLIALQNACYQLLHAADFEEALVATVGYGGDTDTNGAICGALLGAAWGRSAIPQRWVETIDSCRPSVDRPGVLRPRPEEYWPVDAAHLARELLGD
jgi:ADP-ribosyl-[dinitrogen reductase] hydrolase